MISHDETPSIPPRFHTLPAPRTRHRIGAFAAAVALSWFAMPPGGAQQAEKPPAESAQAPVIPAAGDAPSLTIADVESRLAAMEADSNLEGMVKDSLRAKFKEAIESLKAAASHTAKAAAFANKAETAPGEIEALRKQAEALPPVEAAAAKLKIPKSAEECQKEIESRQATLGVLKKDLESVTNELAQSKTRPVEISARLPEARQELEQVRARLASPGLAADPSSPGRVADRTAAEALAARLAAELNSLENERRSQPRVRDLLQTRSALLERQAENEDAALTALKAAMDRDLAMEAREVVKEASDTVRETSGKSGELQELAAEVDALAKEFESVVKRLKKTSSDQDLVTWNLKRLNRETEVIREQLNLGQAGRLMAQSLFDLRQQLPNRFALAQQLQRRREDLGGARLAALAIEEKLRDKNNFDAAFPGRESDSAQGLLSTRADLLTKLETQYDALVLSLSDLIIEEAKYLEKVRQTASYLENELFWVRGSPPAGADTVAGLPAAFRALFGAKVWAEYGRAINEAFTGAPFRSLAILAGLAALVLTRPRLVRNLRRTGEQTRRISTDRYSHTALALLLSFLLVLPFPLLLLAAAWILKQEPGLSEWGRAAQSGLQLSAALAFPFLFARAACRPGGLGVRHFRWRDEVVERVLFASQWFAIVSVPAFLVIRISFSGDAGEHFDSLARICFVLASGFASFLLWKLLWSRGGILKPRAPGGPQSLSVRFALLCFGLAVLIPVILLVLALAGYLYTAVVLSLECVVSAAIIGAGGLVYWMTVRWFRIRERQLALSEALAERKARRDAANREEETEESEPDEVVAIEGEEEEMDLSASGRQTRRLLRFLCGLGAVLALGFLWSQTIPLFTALDKIHLVGGFSAFDLANALVVAAVTLNAARNLPGFLELAVLRVLDIQPGTRVAIVTLCQYALIACGVVILFNVLNVEWAKFGWIAAALSVGIGFGLQEVVANFVCGLILLFERPVRVGDIITVEGTTGTVSRIQMRATTIINWDRQELVIPNKTFVTGTILNWTLSSTVNRVVIPVGVAYGSDTKKALKILLEVADAHPAVLEDPAPMATFEAFAHSSLTLILRGYLPNLDNRIATITDLHSEINRRFAEAGIEIAYPQRDLHIRSVDAGIEWGRSDVSDESRGVDSGAAQDS